jgi:hypothetical protein
MSAKILSRRLTKVSVRSKIKYRNTVALLLNHKFKVSLGHWALLGMKIIQSLQAEEAKWST